MNNIPESLRSTWNNFSYEQEAWKPASKIKGYHNLFSRGYLLTRTPHSPNLPGAWRTELFGDWRLHYDSDLPIHVRRSLSGDQSIIVLGHAFDPESGILDSAQAADVLLKALSVGDSWDSLDEQSLWLGGRFLILALDGRRLRVLVDPMASKSCFWGESKGQIYLSSHSEIIARATGVDSSDRRKWVFTHPEYDSKFGASLPGLITAHDSARLVYANCALEIDGSKVTHERIFPRLNLEMQSVASATEQFISALRNQVEMWFRASPKTAIALTAGMDSRALLASSLDIYERQRATTLTYHFFKRDAPTTRVDLLEANKLSLYSNLRHRVMNIEPIEGGTPMSDLYTGTFTSWARFPGLARIFYENLSPTQTLTIGIGGGIGTVHHTNRADPKITPEVLARRYTPSALHKNTELHDVMSEYIDYVQFDHARIANYDFYDLFHWEHRLSNWAALGYAEYELGPMVALPFNSRRVILPMLTLPLEQRRDKSLYKQIMEWSGFGVSS